MFFGPRLQVQAQDFWSVEPLDQAMREPLHSEIPTLILNGELDHVLPPRYTQEAAGRLKNGHLFLFAGVAHSPIDYGDCALGMLLQFFADPSKKLACVAQFEHVLKTESPAS